MQNLNFIKAENKLQVDHQFTLFKTAAYVSERGQAVSGCGLACSSQWAWSSSQRAWSSSRRHGLAVSGNG